MKGKQKKVVHGGIQQNMFRMVQVTTKAGMKY